MSDRPCRKSSIASLVLLLTLTAGVFALPTAVTTPPAELDLLRDAFMRSVALKAILKDPKFLDKARAPKAKLEAQVETLAERCDGLALAAIDKIGADLRDGKADLLEAAVASIARRPFPEAQGFVELARRLKARLKFEATQEGGDRVAARIQAQVGVLDQFLAARKDEGKDPARDVVRLMKNNFDCFWESFASDGMAANQDTTSAVEGAHKLDLNQASEMQLREIQGVTAPLARAIVDHRAQNGPFDSLDELDRIPGIGPATLKRLQTCTFVADFRRPEKEWTVLFYCATANNREKKGIFELNLLERIGTTDKINIVNQLARIDADKIEDPDMGDDVSNANWASVRRYLVRKDDDPKDEEHIVSSLVGKLGRVDMSDPKTLADFCKWGIECFPARHYLLVIRTHGGGALSGMATDDYSEGPGIMRTPKVREALAEANEFLKKKTGRAEARLDLVCLAACLMGSWEVVYELRDQTPVVVASETLSYGCFEWDLSLADLAANPALGPKEIAYSLIEKRVTHVMQMKRGHPDTEMTLGAYDTTRLAPMTGALDALAKSLSGSLSTTPCAYTMAATSAASLTGDTVDLQGFCEGLLASSKDAAVVAAAKRVRECLGYPPQPASSDVVKELTLVVDKPGDVLWGLGWHETAPPKEIWPAGSRYHLLNLVRSTASGPNGDGKYEVVFPDFDAKKLKVRSIRYQTIGPRGGLGPMKLVTNFHPNDRPFVAREFGPESPLIADAHTGGHADTHGLSLVVPIPADPTAWHRVQKRYTALQWAKDTAWGALISQVGSQLMPAMWRK